MNTLWYASCSLRYRDIGGMMLERGIALDATKPFIQSELEKTVFF
jgi:hypothetical protein